MKCSYEIGNRPLSQKLHASKTSREASEMIETSYDIACMGTSSFAT